MAEIEHLIYPLPKTLIGVLTAMVDVAKSEDTLSVTAREGKSKESGKRCITISHGEAPRHIDNLISSPINSLHCAGFIVSHNNDSVFLTPAAFDRVRYENRGRIGKWEERLRKSGSILSTVSLVISFIAFLISVGLSPVIKLLQIYKYLPTPSP